MSVREGRLIGRVALVTGSSYGIGRAIAERFAREGARVVVNSSQSAEAADAVVHQIAEHGGEAIGFRVDVSKRPQIHRMVEQVVERFGRIDILVNNAGVSVEKPLLQTTEREWDRVMDVNVKGVFLCTQAVIPVMLGQGGGKIINLSSISATVGHPELSAYCASKGAVSSLTTQLALEFGPSNIRVNAIAPGTVNTPMNSGLLDDERKRQAVIDATPLRCLGTPDDVAAVATFLASDESDFMTGATIVCDGGWLTQ